MWRQILFPFLFPLLFLLHFLCHLLPFCSVHFSLPLLVFAIHWGCPSLPLHIVFVALSASLHHLATVFGSSQRPLSLCLSLSVSLVTEFLRCNSSRVIRTCTYSHTHTVHALNTWAQARNACLTAHVSHKSQLFPHCCKHTHRAPEALSLIWWTVCFLLCMLLIRV